MSTPSTITVADPRFFDGNPHEVADRAIRQCIGLSVMLEEALGDAVNVALNAGMERQIALNGEPDATAWMNSPEAKTWGKVTDAQGAIRRQLEVLRKAAAFDPRARQ